jgi:hypothetical protein
MRATTPVFAMVGLAIAAEASAAQVIAAQVVAQATASQVRAADVLADPPSDLSVTVYRAPYREAGSINLDDLQGFALISETRTVHLPAGRSRLRFEGVANGIEPASAIVTGLPGGVIEKNRDARLLSPSALIASALGKPVELLRTIPKTGKTERLTGTLKSDADGGVVFQSAQGIEALRCSGLPETFSFAPVADLSARPTLSVEVHSPRAETKQVTLSYLSRGFDWAADYTTTLSADGKSLDLGAWVTLANSNGMGFPSAHTQVVAGKVNREDGEIDPIDIGRPILAQCWPQGSTSDLPMMLIMGGLSRDEAKSAMAAPMAMKREAFLQEVVVTGARKVEQEQLGDLKLYRLPERTTLASRQSKQVRLLDRSGIPVNTVYGAEVGEADEADEADDSASIPASRLLRTRNTAANHLGLPLPSGSVAVFGAVGSQNLLEHESGLRDIAVEEEVEIDMGVSADVQVSVVNEKVSIDPHAVTLPLVPGVSLRSAKVQSANRVAISNARASDIQFELRLQLEEGARVVRADHALGTKNGRPIFRLRVPANETVTVRYQVQHTAERILRTP